MLVEVGQRNAEEKEMAGQCWAIGSSNSHLLRYISIISIHLRYMSQMMSCTILSVTGISLASICYWSEVLNWNYNNVHYNMRKHDLCCCHECRCWVDWALTSSCCGTGPGSMLFAAEYIFGMCLSWLQRTHSDVFEWSLMLGNPSEQEVQVTLRTVFICLWKARIFAWTAGCSNNGMWCCAPGSCPCISPSFCNLSSLLSGSSVTSRFCWLSLSLFSRSCF